MFDIYTIIFLALAVFIFLRLRSVLGQRTGNERPPYDPFSSRNSVRDNNANDKVVVFDRMRENLRKFKTMPLDQLVDQSINETMNRTLGTSMTLLLSAVPLALLMKP